ncbi:MAG TPA: DUF3099 domain-containing protein [Nocardioidaceae bacterium]|nr:DUF3099 domain-containing protein [Nocardioidaceae bacterium]
MARKEPDPVRITSANRGSSADIQHRQRRYLISMGVRTACFVAAVGVFIAHGRAGWAVWVLVAASFVLPYVAVVMANARSHPDPGGPEYFEPGESGHSLEGPPEK